MTTSRGEIAEGRVLFTCPVCGTRHDGPLRLFVEMEGVDDGDLWHTVSMFVRQTLRTSACPDVFVTRSIISSERTYAMKMLTYGDDRPTELYVKPRMSLAEAVAASKGPVT